MNPALLASILAQSPNSLLPLTLTYKAEVEAQGATLTGVELSALNDGMVALQAKSVYAKLRDLWVPLSSSSAGAYVKLINATGANNPMTTTSAPTYAEAVGITGVPASSTFLATGLVPTTAGMTQKNWGYGIYSLISPTATPVGRSAGTRAVDHSFIGDSTAGKSKINDASLFTTGLMVATPGLRTVQAASTVAQSYINGLKLAETAVSANNDTGEIALLMENNAVYGNDVLGGYAAWDTALTRQEHLDLQAFFQQVNLGVGRSGLPISLVAVGDSNTAGVGVTDTTRWSYLFASAVGMANTSGAEVNIGLSGSSISVTGVHESWTVNMPYKPIVYPGIFYTVMLGTNDAAFGVNIDTFQTDYTAYIQKMIDSGIPANKILLIAPPYCNNPSFGGHNFDPTTTAAFGLRVEAVAASLGTLIYNPFTLTQTNAATWYQSDNIHLNTAGHAGLSSALHVYLQSLGYQ